MFTGQLNQAQRKSFLAMATKMTLADAKVALGEVKVLDGFTADFGDGVAIPPNEVYGPINTEVFDAPASRKTAVLGMLVIAYSDEHFHIDELSVLNEAVTAFNIPADELEPMKAWAQRAAALFNQFYAMVNAE